MYSRLALVSVLVKIVQVIRERGRHELDEPAWIDLESGGGTPPTWMLLSILLGALWSFEDSKSSRVWLILSRHV